MDNKMTPCKGIHRISCTRKNGCPRKLKKDVQPDCMDCQDALTQIIDLDDKILFEYQIKKQTKARKRK